jgi:hypothetical protein
MSGQAPRHARISHSSPAPCQTIFSQKTRPRPALEIPPPSIRYALPFRPAYHSAHRLTQPSHSIRGRVLAGCKVLGPQVHHAWPVRPQACNRRPSRRRLPLHPQLIHRPLKVLAPNLSAGMKQRCHYPCVGILRIHRRLLVCITAPTAPCGVLFRQFSSAGFRKHMLQLKRGHRHPVRITAILTPPARALRYKLPQLLRSRHVRQPTSRGLMSYCSTSCSSLIPSAPARAVIIFARPSCSSSSMSFRSTSSRCSSAVMLCSRCLPTRVR